MSRVRTDNVFGTITDNPLSNVATTMNSAGLANLAAVSSAEAIIILDPNRVSGAPEIVVVTAHTGSATSATIVRGQFGTSAREHAAGTEWVHGPIAGNSVDLSDDLDDLGDIYPAGVWAAWTPTLTNMTQGSGTVVARFTRVGTTIFWRFEFTLGSGSAMGSSPRISAPVTMATYTNQRAPIGTCEIADTGTANFRGGVWENAGAIEFFASNASTTTETVVAISATSPMTWASGDILSASGFYEAAS